MAESAPADDRNTIPLNARIEPALQAEIDEVAREDVRPGEFANRSRTVRFLLRLGIDAYRATSARQVV